MGREIREAVVFAPQNVIMDPPFTKLDILVCRNLLIYLTPELQKKLLPLFHYSLKPGGALFLGSAETIGNLTSLFAPLDAKSRLYRRLGGSLTDEPVAFPASFLPPSPATPPVPRPQQPAPNLQALVDQVLLTDYAPAAVLTGEQGDILYINGRTGRYLEPAAGKANWNLFAMAREGLRYELASAFPKALRERGPVVLKAVKVGTNGGEQLVDVTIRPLTEPEALRETVLVVLSDVPAAPQRRRRAKAGAPPVPTGRFLELQQECEQSRHELRSTREEMQASQEELKSMNEELQSNNEELQSTNEELTTSKEEMQSMNEELQTVNQELQAKVTDLSQVNNDMKNLLDSTDIATLFLDDALHVRRFTSRAAQIIKLIPGDAGRPITDIASDLIYPEFTAEARQVIRKLSFLEKEVITADGRWFLVRIMPYRTLENRIDGLVITFTDITRAKTLEAQLRQAQSVLERRVVEQSVKLAEPRRERPRGAGRREGKQAGTPAPRRPGKKQETPT